MPIYEFKCSSCGHQFEALVLGGDKDNGLKCPRCNGESLERLLSIFSKGKGEGLGTSALPSGAGCSSPSSSFS